MRIATVAALIAVFTALALSNALSTSATVDEPFHLVAGYSYLTDGDFRLNPEHPPLVKIVATLPARLANAWPVSFAKPERANAALAAREAELQWNVGTIDRMAQLRLSQLFLYGFSDDALRREGVVRTDQMPNDRAYAKTDFVNDPVRIVRAGRLVALSFGLILAIVLYAWGRRLWGFWGGVIALALFTFDPNFIAHSALVTTDVAAAAGFAATMYAFWEWSRRPSTMRAFIVGGALGLSFLVKFNTVLLIPVIVILVALHFLRTRQARESVLLLLIAAVTSVSMVWAGYAFRYSATRDPRAARTAELAAIDAVTAGSGQIDIPRRRFSSPGEFPTREVVHWEAAQRDVLASGIPYHPIVVAQHYGVARPGIVGRITLLMNRFRLLPEAYLHGFATAQQLALARQTFLRGEFSITGFRSYFAWTALLKVPLIALVTMIAGLVVAVRDRKSRGFAVLALVVPIVVLAIVLIQSPLNIGHRHSLPVYPFLFILSGSLARYFGSRRGRAIAAVAAAMLVVSSLVVFAPPWRPQLVVPHHLSYFNELAGGPIGGHRFLSDSNIDWGQDLPALKKWNDTHRDAGPINLNFFGGADPRYYAVPHRNLGFGFAPAEQLSSVSRPGYVVISATHLSGVSYEEHERQMWRRLLSTAEPVGRISYSMFVYRVR